MEVDETMLLDLAQLGSRSRSIGTSNPRGHTEFSGSSLVEPRGRPRPSVARPPHGAHQVTTRGSPRGSPGTTSDNSGDRHRRARRAPARLHRAWWVAAVTMGALVAAAGFRSSTGALLEPLEEEFGWSRATTSGAVSLNLIVYGLTAPFAAALMERFGIRRVVVAALALVAVGSGLTLVMTSAWQLWLLWGFAVGIGTGALALVFGAIVANRWFVRHRGMVIGRLLGGRRQRAPGLPACDRLARRRPGLAVCVGARHAASHCCWCRWCCC